jgi:hypothetical protein
MQHLTPLTTFVGSKKLHIVENISLVLSLQFASPIFIVMVSSSRCGIVQQRTKIILATFLRNNCRKQNVAYCHYISQSFIFIFSLWNCPTKNKKTTLRWEIQFWHNWWDILKENTQISCRVVWRDKVEKLELSDIPCIQGKLLSIILLIAFFVKTTTHFASSKDGCKILKSRCEKKMDHK